MVNEQQVSQLVAQAMQVVKAGQVTRVQMLGRCAMLDEMRDKTDAKSGEVYTAATFKAAAAAIRIALK